MFHDAPDQDGASTEVLTDLDRALSRTPGGVRPRSCSPRWKGGLPLDEVAQIMDCPVGTVKSRIFRAKKERLRDYLRLRTGFQG